MQTRGVRQGHLSPWKIRNNSMSCLEDKPKKWVLPGKFACEKCFATHDKRSKLCKPAKNKSKKPRKPK